MLTEILPLIPALLWVLYLTISNFIRKGIPEKVVYIGYVLLILSNLLINGWISALISLILSSLITVLFVFTKVVSRNVTLAYVFPLAALPYTLWWVILPGFLLAGAIAAVKLRKIAGKGYLSMVSGETMTALGATPNSLGLPMSKPQPNRLPIMSSSEAGNGLANKVASQRIMVSAYALAGMVLSGTIYLIFL